MPHPEGTLLYELKEMDLFFFFSLKTQYHILFAQPVHNWAFITSLCENNKFVVMQTRAQEHSVAIKLTDRCELFNPHHCSKHLKVRSTAV